MLTVTVLNFEVYLSYSNEFQYEITPLFEGTMLTICFFMTTILLAMYNSTFANYRTATFVKLGIFGRSLMVLMMAGMV